MTPRSRSATVKACSRFSWLDWRYTLFMSIRVGLETEQRAGLVDAEGQAAVCRVKLWSF